MHETEISTHEAPESAYSKAVEETLKSWPPDNRRELLIGLLDAQALAQALMAILLASGIGEATVAARLKPLAGTDLPDDSEKMLSRCFRAGRELVEERAVLK